MVLILRVHTGPNTPDSGHLFVSTYFSATKALKRLLHFTIFFSLTSALFVEKLLSLSNKDLCKDENTTPKD